MEYLLFIGGTAISLFLGYRLGYYVGMTYYRFLMEATLMRIMKAFQLDMKEVSNYVEENMEEIIDDAELLLKAKVK